MRGADAAAARPASNAAAAPAPEDDSEEAQMARLMGFGGFGSTKGKEVADNQHGAARGAVKKNQNRSYRQYMNRRGGFNRPLENIK
jgi:U4/U6.U5 tri-snRNP-associated protein 3